MVRVSGRPLVFLRIAATAALVCSARTAAAAGGADAENARFSERYTGKYLYTKPDASAGGGIRGTVSSPRNPIVGVFALPPNEPRFCYQGDVTGSEQNAFVFTGLPVAKYDLVIVYEDEVFEGLTLVRGESDLTARDNELIEQIVHKSEPFFNRKIIHRRAGKTGQFTGQARCIATFLRTKSMVDYMGKLYTAHRRAFKLVVLEQTGPGWQIARTREIYTTFVPPEKGALTFRYAEQLGSIRVTDDVKDLGELTLYVQQGGR